MALRTNFLRKSTKVLTTTAVLEPIASCEDLKSKISLSKPSLISLSIGSRSRASSNSHGLSL